jgi:hypothetical protein
MSASYWKAVAMAGLALVLSACSERQSSSPEQVEGVVRERAQAWADALIAGDLEGAYALTSPNYRQIATSGAYHARVAGSAGWDKAQVDEIQCSDIVCKVKYLVEYRVDHMKVDVRRPLDYKWVEFEGEWYLYVPLL